MVVDIRRRSCRSATKLEVASTSTRRFIAWALVSYSHCWRSTLTVFAIRAAISNLPAMNAENWVAVSTGVLALVVTVSVEDPVAGFGVKVPVAPVGNPLTLNVTAPVKLLNGLMVTL